MDDNKQVFDCLQKCFVRTIKVPGKLGHNLRTSILGHNRLMVVRENVTLIIELDYYETELNIGCESRNHFPPPKKKNFPFISMVFRYSMLCMCALNSELYLVVTRCT
jgi:hypothetical protein